MLPSISLSSSKSSSSNSSNLSGIETEVGWGLHSPKEGNLKIQDKMDTN